MGGVRRIKLDVVLLPHLVAAQVPMQVWSEPMADQGVATAVQWASVDNHDGAALASSLLCSADQRRHVSAEPGDAGHLRFTRVVQANREVVGELRRAGAPRTGVEERFGCVAEIGLSHVGGAAGSHPVMRGLSG